MFTIVGIASVGICDSVFLTVSVTKSTMSITVIAVTVAMSECGNVGTVGVAVIAVSVAMLASVCDVTVAIAMTAVSVAVIATMCKCCVLSNVAVTAMCVCCVFTVAVSVNKIIFIFFFRICFAIR